jgi:anaerobic selenocysteine-containing dehydrogenase
MAKVPFFVHMVTNPSEMTQFADIVLPSTFNSAEGWSIVGNMGNGHGYASIQQAAVKRLWDVKQEETEVMWLLAEKLKAKGFPNLFDYYANEFKDPETGKAPTTALEFSEIATKITSAPIWMAKEPLKGDAADQGWADFKAKGMFSGPKYTLKKGWGGKFATATKKFEFYSETLKKGCWNTPRSTRPRWTTSWPSAATWRAATGLRAALRAAQAPRQRGRLPLHLHRLQVAPEPRRPQSPTCPGTRSSRRSTRVMCPGATWSR